MTAPHETRPPRADPPFDVTFLYDPDGRTVFACPDFADDGLRTSDWTRGSCAGIPGVDRHAVPEMVFLRFEPGAAPLVQRALESLGYRIDRQDHRDSSKGLVVRADWLGRQGREDREFIGVLLANRRRRILTASGTERARLVALAARAMPRRPMTIAIGSRDLAREFARALGRLVDEPIGLHLDGNTRSHRRLVVGSLAAVRCQSGQIVVFLDGPQALTGNGRDALLACRDDRFYGSSTRRSGSSRPRWPA